MALGRLVFPQPAAASALPDGFSRARQECGMQTGASQTCGTRRLRGAPEERNRLGYKACGRVSSRPRRLRGERKLRGVNSMDKPNGRLVLVSYAHYCASTPSLSTRSSSWALQGDLILGRASRLYAFSGYHNRTSLPSRALGRTTGTQEVRSSRSSRTKDSPPQISYAHSR